MPHLICTTQVMPAMVIPSLPSAFMSWLKTKQVVVFVIKPFLTALKNWFAKRLVILASLICAKRHRPKQSVWHSVLTLL